MDAQIPHWNSPSIANGPQPHPAQDPPLGSENAEPPAPDLPVVAAQKSGPKRRGPRPMTDRATKRFEGQLYPEQHHDLSALLTRLTMENKNVPASKRRRFTVNSLIRIGAEVVRDHQENLHGATEDELLDSLRESILETPDKQRSRRRPTF